MEELIEKLDMDFKENKIFVDGGTASKPGKSRPSSVIFSKKGGDDQDDDDDEY